MITLIHPSRSRPELALNAAVQWTTNAGCNVEHILTVDADDPRLSEYKACFGEFIMVSENRSAIDAINNAAKVAKGDIIVVMSDDFICFPDWGKAIEEFTKDKVDWILKTQDGIQNWIITLPIMDMAYYARFGYIYHPDYQHAFCDTEMSCVADLTGRRLTSPMMFQHLNKVGTKIMDDVQVKNDATFASGMKIFIERSNSMFGVSFEDRVGKLPDNVYTRMI